MSALHQWTELGCLFTRENDDHHWIEGNYGYKKDEIDLLKESYFYPTIEVKKGSDAAFWTMYNYATTTSPSSPSYYSTMATMMDLENMVDYFASETYYPNDDWMGGGNNNLKLWRPTKPGGRFRYLSYDLDFGMGLVGSVSNDMLGTALNPSPHNYNSDIFQKLVQNSTFKRYFINRYADLINTIWLPSSVQSMAYLFRDSLRKDMHFQYEKWGGGDTNQWNSNIATMLTFANQRPANARNFIQSHFSMTSQVTLTIQVSPAGAGRIQISTVTPTSYPWSGVYFNGNPVTITAIPNPGYTFDHWRSNTVINTNDLNQVATYNFTSSDVITCYFTGASASIQLLISEINYNSDSASNSGDWIELYNPAGSALDISGWKFRDDADNHIYTFPAPTTIPANGYLVVASDLAKFNSIYPTVTNVVGNYGFDFDNGGEDLRVYNFNNVLYTSVLFDDFSPWPVSPDGQGYTLERIFPLRIQMMGTIGLPVASVGHRAELIRLPSVSVNASGSTSLCQGNSVTLSASVSSGYTFQWKNNGVDINGANQSTYAASQAGSYTVSITGGGCSGISSPVVVTVNPAGQVNSTTPASRCGTGSLVLAASGTTTLEWYDALAGGNLVGSGNSLNTPSISLTTTYYVMAGGACPGPRVAVTAGILPNTAAPLTQDEGRCGSGTVVLSASDTAIIHWYSAISGGTLLATGTSFTTPVLTQSTTYYVEAGTACPSARVPVTAVISSATANPVASNVSRCGPGTITLNATDTATIFWYNAASGGTLLSTGPSFTTPSLSTTTTYYVEAGAFCPSARIAVQAIITPIAAAPLTQNASRCGTGSVTLNATDTAAIRWYNAASGGTQVGSGTTFLTPSLSSTTTYYAEAGSVCPSARVAAQAIINATAATPVASDVSRCGTGSVTLTATDTAVVRWYSAASGGTLLFTGSNFTTPSLSTSTTYYAEAGSVCPSARVAVTAVIASATATPIASNVNRCGPGVVTLSATDTATIFWYSAASGGTLLATGGSFTTPSLSSTTTYYVEAGAFCPSIRISVQAVINSTAAAPLTQNASRCGTGSVTLTATDTAAIRWYNAISGGTQVGSGTSFVTPSISSTTTYYAEAGLVCPSARIAAQAIINAVAASPVTSNVSRCGNGTVTLTATDTAVIRWYSAASGGTLLFTGTSYTTPSLSATTSYYVEAGSVCPSQRVQVSAIINPVTAVPVVQNASRCGSGTVVLSATSSSTVNWYTSPGGTLLGTGLSFTTPSITTTTTYYAVAGTTCPSNAVAVQAIVNQQAAAPVTQNANRCGTGSVTLTASDTASIRWYAAISGGSQLGTGTSFVTPSLSVDTAVIRWYSAASGGTLLATGTTYTTPVLSTTTSYYVEAGTFCPSPRVQVNAIIATAAADPVVTNASRCGTGTVSLSATSSFTVSWFSAPGGTLLGTGNTFTTPSISSTTTYYAQASAAGCQSNFIAAQAIINTVAAAPLTQGAGRCGPGSVTLTATDTAAVRWYAATSGGAILGNGNNFVTPSLSVSTTYYAEAGSVCPSIRVAALASVNAVTATPVTQNASRCGAGTLILTATDTAAIRWYSVASGGSQIGTGSSFTTPVLSASTTYYVEAGSLCPSARIPVQATVYAIAAAPVTSDASRCGTGTVVLTATDTAAVRWYSAASGGTVLFTGYSFTTPVLSASTTYYAEAGLVCPSARVSAMAAIRAVTAAPVTQNASRCGAGTVILTASDTAAISWYDAAIGGALMGTGTNFTTPVLSQTVTYYAQAGSICPSARIPAQAIINAITSSPVAPDVARCGPGSIDLTATDTALVSWYDAASGGNLLATGSAYTTPSLSITTTYYVEAGTFCPSPRVAVNAIITSAASDPLVQDVARCGDGTLTLTAVCPFTVSWYDAPGGNLLGTGLTFTTSSLSQTTTFYTQSGTGTCLSAIIPVQAIVNAITADPVVTGATRCGSGSVTLIAIDTAAVYWYDVASGGTVISTGPTFLTPTLSQSTTFYVQAGSICPSQMMAVDAIINTVSPDPLVSDTTHCGPGSLTLNAIDTSLVYWYNAAIGGTTLATGPLFTTPVLTQTTTYYVQAGGQCPSGDTDNSSYIRNQCRSGCDFCKSVRTRNTHITRQ
ncbi:MAG: CotH kinase family protein [Bacteroidetes bacterium]|nr:CotH kinase family protein [Bacteroidota bacterium]